LDVIGNQISGFIDIQVDSLGNLYYGFNLVSGKMVISKINKEGSLNFTKEFTAIMETDSFRVSS